MNLRPRRRVTPGLVVAVACFGAIAGGVLEFRATAATMNQPGAGPPAALVPPQPVEPSTFAPPTSFGPATEFGPTTGQFDATKPAIAKPAPAAKPPADAAKTGAAATKIVIPRKKPDRGGSTTASAPPATGPQGKPTIIPSPGVMIPPQAMNPAQKEVLNHISAYFNTIRSMQGDFIQVGPRGEQSEGVFFLSRPGKVRFHYNPPVRVDVISDGKSVAVEDRSAMTQNVYPLSKTPLKHLLAERIDLSSNQIIGGYREEPDLVSIELAESTFGDGKLTLIFDRTSLKLRQWVVTDAQGKDTSVAIYNVETDKAMDQNLFKIYVTQDLR